jgi:glycogen synthase
MARPLIAMISRMIDQKGFDLLAHIADELPRLDGWRRAILNGSVRRLGTTKTSRT